MSLHCTTHNLASGMPKSTRYSGPTPHDAAWLEASPPSPTYLLYWRPTIDWPPGRRTNLPVLRG